jgi:hypothetical protein
VLRTLPPQPIKRQVYGTAGVPIGSVIMVEPSAVVTGYEGNAQIYMSPDAAAHMESETPQEDISGAGPVMSSFQTDSQLLKLVMRCAWGVRSGGAQYINGATW